MLRCGIDLLGTRRGRVLSLCPARAGGARCGAFFSLRVCYTNLPSNNIDKFSGNNNDLADGKACNMLLHIGVCKGRLLKLFLGG